MPTLTQAIPGRWFKGRRNRAAHYYRPGEIAICGTYAHSGSDSEAEAAATAPKCQKCLGKLGL